MDIFQLFGIVVGLVSAVTAVVSVAFAWKAVRDTELNNKTSIIVQLHTLYHSDKIFQATIKCSELYSLRQKSSGNKPLSPAKAAEFIKETINNPEAWKAVHDLESFWRYIALLVRRGDLSQDIAFCAFSSPEILGLLFPIENAWNKEQVYERSLECLYDRYQKWKKQPVRRKKRANTGSTGRLRLSARRR